MFLGHDEAIKMSHSNSHRAARQSQELGPRWFYDPARATEGDREEFRGRGGGAGGGTFPSRDTSSRRSNVQNGACGGGEFTKLGSRRRSTQMQYKYTFEILKVLREENFVLRTVESPLPPGRCIKVLWVHRDSASNFREPRLSSPESML